MGLGTLLADWLRLGSGQCLNRRDAKLWAEARTLEDLGRLTAMWLRGEIRSQPGYYGEVDVDEDDAPGLTDALVACNLAGFVTRNSQAGHDGPGSGGQAEHWWTQLAAVDGYADDDTLAWLIAEVMRPGRYEVRAWKASGWRLPGWGRDEDHVVVTRCEGQAMTGFGRHSRSDVEFEFDGVGDESVAEALAAWQVTVFDPEPGRNDLWDVLREAAERHMQ